MSIRLMTEAWKSDLATGPKMVLLALCDSANDQGECYPSVLTLVEKCSMSQRSVFSHIDMLSKIGAVSRKNRPGRSTVYHLDPCKFCTPANSAPLQSLHTTPANSAPPTPANFAPTPANFAPPPLQILHPTPANFAPITVIESSVLTVTQSSSQAACLGEAVVVDRETDDDDGKKMNSQLREVCRAMRAAGLATVSPTNAKLVEILAAGASLKNFLDGAQEAVARGKGVAYALAVAADRHGADVVGAGVEVGSAVAAVAGAKPPAKPADVARMTLPGVAGRDPVLVAIERDAARAARPSAETRARMASIKAAAAAERVARLQASAGGAL